MSALTGREVGVNPYLDVVYRMPVNQGEIPIPLGTVSKSYRLVDHHLLVRTVDEILTGLRISPSKVQVKAEWTIHGERARFSLILPDEDRFCLKVGDDQMRFRIELFNSVEGSCRLMAVAGWLRFVCSNGLILGTALMQLRRQHRQQFQLEELTKLLREAVEGVSDDRRTIDTWMKTKVSIPQLENWADNDVCDKWGLKGAVRTLSISATGHDAQPKGDLKNKRPSEVMVDRLDSVPGIVAPVTDVFGVSQALTWLAGQRVDLQEDLEWRSQVPELLKTLIDGRPQSLFSE
jgi:hypothetical protein